MSGNQTGIFQGHKGDLYYRPTTRLDVCKFFVLNYLLHAFTVISEPGAGALATLFHSGLAVFLPFSGVQYSSYIIYKSHTRYRNDLERAAKGRALCFLMPARLRRGESISPAMTMIHGTFPIHDSVRRMATARGSTVSSSARVLAAQEIAGGPYELVLVPRHAPVESSLPEDSIATTGGGAVRYKTTVASNSNVMKSAIAILQIGYGSYELYDAYKEQLERFGYASHALTVIPYILISFLNLTASLLQSGYNAMYLVHHRGEKDYEYPADLRDRKSSQSLAGGSGPDGREPCLELAAIGAVSTGKGGGGEVDG